MDQVPGLFPTTYLKLVLSLRAASAGQTVSLRADGIDSGSLVRGKVLFVDRDDDGKWTPVGAIIGSRSAGTRSAWLPKNSKSMYGVTLEGYRGDQPLYFLAPPVPPGDYRIRLDLIHGRHEIGDVQARTATLYGYLRILAPRPGGPEA